MVSWSEFEREAPDLAARGRELLDQFEVAFLATVRRNGSPRLHPIVPIRSGLGLYVAVSVSSPKRFDMRRGGRYMLHAMLGERDEEFSLQGFTRLVEDPAEIAAVASAARHVVRPSDDIFEFLIARCRHAYWEHVGQPGTFPVRSGWTSRCGC
jgi:hypothetical protein